MQKLGFVIGGVFGGRIEMDLWQVYDWYGRTLAWLDAAAPESAFSVPGGYEGHSRS